jgi:hypothetical protein
MGASPPALSLERELSKQTLIAHPSSNFKELEEVRGR